jgi:hypothetical protein
MFGMGSCLILRDAQEMGGRSKSSPGSIPRETPAVGGAAHTGRSQTHIRVGDPLRIPQSLDQDLALEGRHSDMRVQ